MKRARHLILSVFLVTVCAALTITAAALRVGDIIDYVVATDIRAFIDGAEIPAYNIGGKLCVVAEDLGGYGFSVSWDGEARTLTLTRDADLTVSPKAIEPTNKYAVGTRLSSVLHTDIVTYLDGREVQSFNIDGRTIIYFSELSAYGTHLYDNDARLSMISTHGHGFAAITVTEIPEEIVHAGGAIDGFVGSNSLEALNTSYEKGNRFLELDFLLSSDGEPICLHDWSQYYSSSLGFEPVTKDKFANVKIYNRYTSITLDRLCEWLEAHTDAYIITDVKDDNLAVLGKIAAEHPEIMDRLAPQIYQYEEYAPVRALGYSNIILTLYRLPKYEDKINSDYNAQFAKKCKLLFVTADVTLVKDGFADDYIAAGVPLFVHTVNDAAQKQALYDAGISGIYTDYAN